MNRIPNLIKAAWELIGKYRNKPDYRDVLILTLEAIVKQCETLLGI